MKHFVKNIYLANSVNMIFDYAILHNFFRFYRNETANAMEIPNEELFRNDISASIGLRKSDIILIYFMEMASCDEIIMTMHYQFHGKFY